MTTPTYVRIAATPFHDEGHGFDLFGFHPPTLAKAARVSEPLYSRYFRVDSDGAHHIPSQGPVIVISNHGGALPVDAAVLCLDLLHHTTRIPRAVSDHFVPRLPLVSTLFSRMGVVSGTRANVRRLLQRGELIAIWPEGVTGPAKRFHDRYRLQSWRVGFAELAIRYRVPVVTAAVIGAEESWPVLAKLRAVRLFGSPYLPIPAAPLPLPAHYHIRYGTPLHLDRGFLSTDADDPEVVAAAAARARVALEQLISDTRAIRRGVFR